MLSKVWHYHVIPLENAQWHLILSESLYTPAGTYGNPVDGRNSLNCFLYVERSFHFWTGCNKTLLFGGGWVESVE